MTDNRNRDRKAGESQLCVVIVDGANLCYLDTYIDAPALPLRDAPTQKDPKQEMEDFLDDLLT